MPMKGVSALRRYYHLTLEHPAEIGLIKPRGRCTSRNERELEFLSATFARLQPEFGERLRQFLLDVLTATFSLRNLLFCAQSNRK